MDLGCDHVDAFKSLWGLATQPQLIRAVENFVYETRLDNRPAILRVSKPGRRPLSEIEAELEWLHFLSGAGISVATPILSRNGRFIETIPGESAPLIGVVFERAAGISLKPSKDLSPEIFDRWGAFLGKMHRVTKAYQPKKSPRPHWSDDISLKTALRTLDPRDDIPYQRMKDLLAWLRTLPRDRDCYGLMHCDLHSGNFLLDGDTLNVFDFDDSCHHWMVFDLAVALYNFETFYESDEMLLPIELLRERFLEGYLRENTLGREWLERLDAFVEYRCVLVYHWMKTALAERLLDDAVRVVVERKLEGVRGRVGRIEK